MTLSSVRRELKVFIKDEKAQGAIEYILLAGGIIVAAIIVYGIYMKMGRSTVEALNRSVGNASIAMENRIKNEAQNQIAGG